MQSRIFPKIVAIEDCHLELVSDLLRGGWGDGLGGTKMAAPFPSTATNSDCRPLGTCETKMAVDRTGPENLTKK